MTSTFSSWECSAIPDVKSYVTCANEEDVVVFAFGRLDLRIHFDLGEPVAVGRRRRKKNEIMRNIEGATVRRNNRIPFIDKRETARVEHKKLAEHIPTQEKEKC